MYPTNPLQHLQQSKLNWQHLFESCFYPLSMHWSLDEDHEEDGDGTLAYFPFFSSPFFSFFLHTTIGTAHSQVPNVKTEMLLNWNAVLLARLSVDARASMYHPSARFTDQHSVNFNFLYCAPYWWLDIIQQWIRPMSRWRKGVKRKMLLNWNTWEMN